MALTHDSLAILRQAQSRLSSNAFERLCRQTLLEVIVAGDIGLFESLRGAGLHLPLQSVDEDGRTILHIASALGREGIVETLLSLGCAKDQGDSFGYTALHWATMTNNPGCAKVLVAAGCSIEAKSRSGYGPSQYASHIEIAPEIVDIGNDKSRLFAAIGHIPEIEDTDFASMQYDTGAYAEMIVWQEADLERILHEIITLACPLTTRPWSSLVADCVFLMARWAAWYGTTSMLGDLLLGAVERIEALLVVDPDLDMLAFLLANASLLTTYIKLDHSIKQVRQAHLNAEKQDELVLGFHDLVNEIAVLIIRRTERDIDKVLDAAILDYENVDIKTFHRTDGLLAKFRSTPDRRQLTPDSVTAILTATVSVLQRHHVHEYIIVQCIGQCLYWMTSELLNRIVHRRKYLSRQKSVQIKLAVSSIEEWVADHYPRLRKLFAPLKQMLQWIAVLSTSTGSIGQALETYPALSAEQLSLAVKSYRYEIGEARTTIEQTQPKLVPRTFEDTPEIVTEDIPSKPWLARNYTPPDVRPSGATTDSKLLLPFVLPPDVGWTLTDHFEPPKPTIPSVLLNALDQLMLEPR